MRASFKNEFERRLVKAARKHCEKIHTLSSPNVTYWQYVYGGETYFGTLDIYDKLVEDGKLNEFPDSIIDEYLSN